MRETSYKKFPSPFKNFQKVITYCIGMSVRLGMLPTIPQSPYGASSLYTREPSKNPLFLL